MTTALLLTGHMRMFDKTAKSLNKNILELIDDDIDIFIHTWDRLEVDNPKEKINPGLFSNAATKDKLEDIFKTYDVRGICIDNYSDIQHKIKPMYASVSIT